MAKKSSEFVLRCLRDMKENPPASVKEAQERLRALLTPNDKIIVEPNRFQGAEEGLRINNDWYRVVIGASPRFNLIFPPTSTSQARPPSRKQRSVAA